MLVSMNWIGDFVDLSGLDPEELIHRFTLSTAEVEEIIYKGRGVKNVVAAKILSIENHPDSKKLHLLKVDIGDGIVDCVCGAPNVREGMTVAFAKEGGMVGGIEITRAKIAGYESCGMCCSEAELGISADNSGLWDIKDELKLGCDLKSVYGIDDTVFEVDNKSLTNRPDLWGHYGIAREFSALTGRALKPIDRLDTSKFSHLPKLDISSGERELVFRYTGIKVTNVTVATSPVNMGIRLFYCGTRKINLLTDLTNYLMLELGQPMHAFDADKVSKIEIKRFDEGFTFKTLDGIDRNIDKDMLMICSAGAPVAVAGIMGGLDSEITDGTSSLLLESANFDAVSVRKTSSRLGLRTDASVRYEKTLDPELTLLASQRLLKLLLDIDPGVVVASSVTDLYVRHYPQIELSFDKKYIDRYTGISISAEQIISTLRALGFGVKYDGSDRFDVSVPSWRGTKDVTICADIVEEITRIYGYDNFKIETTMSALFPVRKSNAKVDDSFVKEMLVEKFSMHEVQSYIWCESEKFSALGLPVENNVRLLNSTNPGNDVLRNCMVPTLLCFAAENKSYAPEYGIFEIGRVVDGLSSDKTCQEQKKLGIVMYSRIKTEKELYLGLRDILAMLLRNLKHSEAGFENCTPAHSWQHTKNCAQITCQGQNLGFLCALHPQNLAKIDKKAAVVCAELSMDVLAALEYRTLSYKEPSKYPGIDYDLSLVLLEGMQYSAVDNAVKSLACPLLGDVSLIDQYEDESGKCSVTIRLPFTSHEKTLARGEVQVYVDSIISALAKLGIALKD
ncbi:MAG: phenylalanine--tRNA ligase subunit beta [Oscillospiraceae bacterium]